MFIKKYVCIHTCKLNHIHVCMCVYSHMKDDWVKTCLLKTCFCFISY